MVGPKARFYHLKWQRPKVGDPSNRRRWRLRQDDSYIRLSGFQGGKGFALFSKRDTMAKESPNTEQLAVGGSRPVDGMRRNRRRFAAPHGVQGPRPLVGKGFSKGETTIGFAL